MERKQVSHVALVFGFSVLIALMGTAITPAFGPGALAATPIYVRADGNDANCDGTVDAAYVSGSFPQPCAVQTIQQGIVLVDPSGTVFVRAGTYVLTAVVNVNKTGITLDGDGPGATIVQVSGTGDRFNIAAPGVTLQDFEIVKTDKAGEQNIIRLTNGNNVTIKNNTIHGQFVIGDGDVSRALIFNAGAFTGTNIESNTIYALRQPAYVSGTHTGTVQNNYVYGTKGWVLEGGNLTFTGNTWGTGAQANVYDVAILSTMPPAYYTDIVAMSNANNEAVIENQRVSPAVLSVVYVDAATAYGSDLGGRYHPYSSITPAVTRVVADGTVKVADGTYIEQVVIDGKNLTLKGQSLNAVIQAPNTVPTCFTTSSAKKPIVCVKNGATATIDTFTIDGAGKGNANNQFVGVAFSNAGGTLKNSLVKDIRDTPFSGAQHGVAIFSYNDNGAARTINVWDNVITGFQKNAMALNASDTTPLTIDVRRNQVTGAGPTSVTAQNGIQAWGNLVTGIVDDNDVGGIAYSGSGYVATSILPYYADLTISNNTVTGGHVGIYNIDGAGQILGNTIGVIKAGVYGYGIIATDPPTAVPSPYGAEDFGSAGAIVPDGATATLVVNIAQNSISFSGGDNTGTVGIEADAGYGVDNLNVTMTDNNVIGFNYGMGWYQCTSSCSAGVFVQAKAFDNSLAGNTIAMESNVTSLTVDASGNWWGTNTPAGVAGAKVGTIDYTPWLNSGTDTNAAPGFQGDFSNLWVDDDSPQVGATGRIQEGINLVTASTVNVAAGTYVGNVNIPASITLKGAQFGAAVSGRTAASSSESTIQGLVTVGASNVVLDGFTLTNPGQTYAVSVGNHTPSYSVIAITHNIVDTVGAVGLAQNVHAIVLTNGPDSVTIAHNRFNNIKASTKSVSAIGVLDSVSADQSTGLVIQDNTFSDIASATKGAYGVLLNNGAGTPGAQIKDNTFSGLNGGWTHAIGLEGPTLNAVVTGNIFSGLTAAGPDKVAVLFEKNLNGGTVNVECNQFNGSTFYGVAIHPNDLPGGSNGYNYVVNAEKNWWGNASGPYDAITNPSGTGALVGPKVDFDPWLASNIGCATTTGNWQNTRTGAFNDLQDSLDDALPNDTILAVGTQPLSGGATATHPGVTINLNGGTFGPGSPFLTVNAANITVNGPGTLDGWTGGANSTSPAILVNSGGDNLIVNGVEIKRWADGVEVAANVTSFKLVNNWIHSNTDAGLQVNTGVTLGGVVTIQGNLFKVNGGNGVQNNGATTNLNAEYNSWGDVSGPTGSLGDGVGGSVDYTPWTFAETYIDVDPLTGGDQYQRNVDQSTSFNVDLKFEAANLYGLAFQFSYDPTYLTFNGPPTFSAPWSGTCAMIGAPPVGTFKYQCYLMSGPAWNGGTVATFNFTANGGALIGNGPWSTYFDVSHVETNTSAGAIGGVKVFVNNAGFNAPTTADRDITDANDGQINITGIAQFTGFVDLQGRPNDSGAALSVYSAATRPGTAIASAASASSGAYTTAYIPSNVLTVGSTYYLYVDRPLYLPTTADAASLYAHSKLLSTRPTTALGTFMLLGGDATDNNVIDIYDAGCIGGAYGGGAVVCNVTGSSDVNGDGATNILDLVLFGGNYLLDASPWTP